MYGCNDPLYSAGQVSRVKDILDFVAAGASVFHRHILFISDQQSIAEPLPGELISHFPCEQCFV